MLQLASGFDNVVVSNPKNLFYLTDFWGGGIGIVRPDSTVLVTSVMEERRARESGREVEVVAAQGASAMWQAAKKVLANGKTMIDEREVPLKGVADPGFFIRARRRKDREEIARITEASRKIDRIYLLLEKTIRPRPERASDSSRGHEIRDPGGPFSPSLGRVTQPDHNRVGRKLGISPRGTHRQEGAGGRHGDR
jgi:Xaa-Pro aminopeptidase